MSLIVGLIVAIGSGIFKLANGHILNVYFWIGLIVEFVLISVIFILIKRINEKTKEIEEI